MVETARQSLQRTEVDAVPVFFTPGAAETSGALVWRVGWADEIAPIHGITNLVTRLVRERIADAPATAGVVRDATTTTFFAQGTPGEVAAYLRATCEAITSLPFEVMAQVAHELRIQGEGASISVVSRLMHLRYGFVAEGLDWLPELGLNDPRPDAVDVWARQNFNSGNCAAWFHGQLPSELAFPLPAGHRIAPPRPRPLSGLVLPAARHSGTSGVAVTFETSRTPAALAAARMARLRVGDSIRMGQPADLDAGGSHDPIDGETAHSAIWIPCTEDRLVPVRLAMLKVLSDLAGQGPSAWELDADLDAFIRQLRDPEWQVHEPETAATNELFGMPALGAEEMIEQRTRVTAADCARELSSALRSTMVVSPADTVLLEYPGFNRHPGWDMAKVAGREFVPAETKPGSKERLIVGNDGIALHGTNGAVTSFLWADCAAVVQERGGTRFVICRNGPVIRFTPRYWRDGAAAARLADAAVPPQLLVPPPA